jgi:hypothetical protein
MGSIPTPNFAFPVQWLRLGTQQLHIIVRPGVQAPRFHHVALNVDDFAALIATLYLDRRDGGVDEVAACHHHGTSETSHE